MLLNIIFFILVCVHFYSFLYIFVLCCVVWSLYCWPFCSMEISNCVEALCPEKKKAIVATGRCRHRAHCHVESLTSRPDHSSNSCRWLHRALCYWWSQWQRADDFTTPVVTEDHSGNGQMISPRPLLLWFSLFPNFYHLKIIYKCY
jgi:hypothetical protein